MSQINAGHIFPPYFTNIHCDVAFHLRFSLASGLFRSGFPTKVYDDDDDDDDDDDGGGGGEVMLQLTIVSQSVLASSPFRDS
jgi:hypothetical protein